MPFESYTHFLFAYYSTPFFSAAYGHERITTCLRRDVVAWQTALRDQGLAHRQIIRRKRR